MAYPLRLGTVGPHEQSKLVINYSPTSGCSTSKSYKGSKAEIDQVIPQLIADGYALRIDREDANTWTVEASVDSVDIYNFGGALAANEVTEVWELAGNKVQKDLLESNCAAVQALTAAQIAQIKKYVQSPPDGTVPAWDNSSLQALVYALLMADMKYAQVNQPVLRHTYSVPRNVGNINAGFSNITYILKTSTMYSTEGVPGDFLAPLTAITPATASITRSDGIIMDYGWYKNMPTVSVSPYTNKREFSQEFEFGLWPILVFGQAI